MHAFCSESDDSGTPSTNDILSRSAFPQAKTLSFAQREYIYQESRGHDGCYKAIALYQAFFDLCPANQQLSIQIKKEDPALVSPFLRQIMEFKLQGPKLTVIATGMKGIDGAKTVITGLEQESLHSVLGFSDSGSSNVDYVVDMTRMQFGNAGRGSFGELYFLGTTADFSKLFFFSFAWLILSK